MAHFHSPRIITEGLVLALDAANTNSYIDNIDIEYLIVAGGGGGAAGCPSCGGAGGGGAGGLLQGTLLLVRDIFNITIGNGGSGGPNKVNNASGYGANGGNTVAFGLTAIGGGGGRPQDGTAGANGGSGGGGSGGSSPPAGAGGLGTAGQGNNGAGGVDGATGGGGGGVASAASAQSGGTGISTNISGTSILYAAGGGGGTSNVSGAGIGGSGIGGNGGNLGQNGQNATSYGSGGGGGGRDGFGGSGSSGIVIIRYKGARKATGGTITFSGGYTIHTFTSSDTFSLQWLDRSGNSNNGTLVNGPTFDSTNLGSLVFDGVDDYVFHTDVDVSNNFCYDIWCLPQSTHQIDTESTTGTSGISGQRYLITAQFRSDTDSGAGVSIGTNGVSVYEHAPSYLPALLVHQVTLNTITHIVINYVNKRPSLYINGIFVKNGLTSPRTNVKMSTSNIGRTAPYGYYSGNLYSAKFYNRALTPQEVLQNYNATKGRYGL